MLLFFLTAAVLSAAARYTIFSVGKNVQIKRNGAVLAADKGMEVKATDYIIIGKGGSIEILNSLNSMIFKCEQEGEFSVTRIMIDARDASETGAAASIREKTRFTGSMGKSSNVYVETGMVKRAMATYDSEGGNIQIEPISLSRHVVNALRKSKDEETAFPVEIGCGSANGGLQFHLVNTMEFPLYFNIIKITDRTLEQIEISELGQPTGCYVLLPGQAISREQFSGIDPAESHILIMTHCRFNIDDLMDGIDEVKKEKNAIAEDGNLSVYFQRLN